MTSVTRKDKITELTKKSDQFSDFLINFDKNPITGALARVINDESIKQSLRNLILTAPGERPYNNTIGCGVYRLLFEPMDAITAMAIENEIRSTILNFEPRVSLVNVSVNPREEDQSYYIDIVFSIINTQVVSQLSLTLNKVR